MLTKNQFLVINELRVNNSITAQSQLAECTDLSVGTINTVVRELRKAGWIEARGFKLTTEGLTQLMPYRVKNAVIMAAGFSSRFAPVSFERPKGLLTVRDEVLIERQIKQLHEVDIYDITVVVGYMKELFFYLGEKYGVDIVVNEEYEQRNNHSSLYRVRDKLSRTFICSSDNYFTENVFEPYVYEAYYAAVYGEGYTEEWCMQVKAHDVISKVTIGGTESWYMLGHVYFDDEFSAGMRNILEAEYDLPATRNKLWEHLYIENINKLRMVMRRYPQGIIYEFDSLADMHLFDPSFIENVDSTIIDNIVQVLGCKRSDIQDIEPIKIGAKNLSCRFRVDDDTYVFRHPNNLVSNYINHASEAFSAGVAKELGIDNTYLFEDPNSGWRISRYVNDCKPLDYHNPKHIERAMEIARTLHTCGVTSPWNVNLFEDIEGCIELLEHYGRASFPDFIKMHKQFIELANLVAADNIAPCLCHNNFYCTNYLVHDDEIDLIDWEYSGMADFAADLGTFICCCPDYTYKDVLSILTLYFGREPSAAELRHCIAYIAIMAFRWYVWALCRDVEGAPEGSLLYTWYCYARDYGKLALELYSDMQSEVTSSSI